MAQFILNVQVKKAVWFEEQVVVTADSLKEAVGRLQECDFECMEDKLGVRIVSPQAEIHSDLMRPEHNLDQPTIEIYTEKAHEEIFNNVIGWKEPVEA